MDNSSLAHTKWNCKYHIVFAPKFRRQIIYGKIKADIGAILRKLCDHKGVEIIEANAYKDQRTNTYCIPFIVFHKKGNRLLEVFNIVFKGLQLYNKLVA